MANKGLLIILLSTCVLIVSCKSESNYEKVKNYYALHKPEGKFDNFRKVVIINGLGNCMNCNNEFALKKMASYIDNLDVLLIISSKGGRVDISPYIDLVKDNIIWDTRQEFDKLNIVKSCAIIDIHDDFKITEISISNICEIE